MVLQHLRARNWQLPDHMNIYGTRTDTKVPRAPLGYNCFFYAAFIRTLLKMVDDLPPATEAKLAGSVLALKILEWYFNKIASGKNEIKVKQYIFESIPEDGNIFVFYERLKNADQQHTSFGKKSFDEYRDDVNVSGYKNADGCVAPTVLDDIRKKKEKDVALRLGGGRARPTTPRRPNKGNGNRQGGSLRSGFSSARGKPPAPLLKDFYDANKHEAPLEDGAFAHNLCKKWQTDSCVLPHGQKCNKFHLCQWCGKPHPGSKCRNI